ncbi:MAG: metal-dependent hydrolase [Candidatus Hodarchaeales archaeon]|jgi:hypothetical protein
MDNSTHYWFSFALIVCVTLFTIQPPLDKQIVTFLLIIPFNLISVLPNLIDSYFCVDRKSRTCTERCRHPFTHHPLLFITLVFFLSAVNVNSGYYEFYDILSAVFLIAFGSHLLLDMISKEGLPLSLKPALFNQDQSKNYTFNEKTQGTKKLRFPLIGSSRNDYKINQRITLACKGIIILYCFRLFYEVGTKWEPGTLEFVLKGFSELILRVTPLLW